MVAEGKIGNPAGGEHERRRLAVEIREFGLEPRYRIMRARDIAGAPRANAMAREGLSRGSSGFTCPPVAR